MNRLHTNALPVVITSNRPKASTLLSELPHRDLAKLPRFSGNALRMDLVVRRHDKLSGEERFSASARLPLPGRDIYATAVHADLPTAIVKLIDRLVRRARQRKAPPKNTQPRRRARSITNGHGLPTLLSAEAPVQTVPVRTSGWETLREGPQTRVAATDRPSPSPAHVLLAIDYTKPSAAVTRSGAALASRTGARLTLLHVLDPVSHEPDIVAHWIDSPEQRRHYELARLHSWSKEHAGMGPASCRVTEGHPWEEIVRFAKANKVDLIVMGRSGSRWFGRLTARTVERVAQDSQCPVLIVGQDQQHAPLEPKQLLLPTDFSADSLEAFPWAERISRRYGASILLANVQDPMALPGTSTYAYFHEQIDERRKQADAELEAWRHTHLAADLNVNTRVMEGLPAPSLCRLVEREQADLVVMSTHGSKGWIRKWLGGTTEGVLRHVTCSVLVVPPRRASESPAGA